MSLAPPVALSRPSFNPLPAYIGLFCVLWSFAFVAGKIGVTDCPPLILLTARFLLAGILILGVSGFRLNWTKLGRQLSWRDAAIFATLGVANNALYLGLANTGLQSVSAGLGSLIVSSNPVFTAALAALLLGEALTLRKVLGLLLGLAGVAFIVWHRIPSAPIACTASCSRSHPWRRLCSLPSCSSCSRPRAASGSAMEFKISPAASCCCRLRSWSRTSRTSCRVGGYWAPSPSWCLVDRFLPTCYGFICSRSAERPPRAPITF